MHQDRFKSHSYGPTAVFRACLNSLGVFPLLAIVLLIVKQARPSAFSQIAGVVPILGLIGVLVVFLIGWLALWQMYPTVQTSAQGIRVRFLWFWWLFVPWDDIAGLYRWRVAGNQIVIVAVDKLTFFHVLYGVVYAEMLKPAFLISTSIAHYDELIQTIKLHTRKELIT
jgi:hypothetical protein